MEIRIFRVNTVGFFPKIFYRVTYEGIAIFESEELVKIANCIQERLAAYDPTKEVNLHFSPPSDAKTTAGSLRSWKAKAAELYYPLDTVERARIEGHLFIGTVA